jgi:hypothetical protein
MKEPGNAAKKLLDLPYAPEAEAYLDELERSGQFRVGPEAEQEEAQEAASGAASNDYSLGRGTGSVSVHDWWTTGRVCLRVAAGIRPEDLAIARVNDSLVLRTQDGLDRMTLEGYLGLIPDASTLRVEFDDGTIWMGADLLARIASWLSAVPPSEAPAGN